jgi:ubiquinone/menaquinone biosynthesis C-methylase UbiE
MQTLAKTPILTVLEEDRHAWFAGRTRAILKYLDSEMAPRRAGEERLILDVGSGAGNMAHHLAPYGRVIGLDNNPRPLGVACDRGLEALQSLGDQMPFDNDTFNLVAMLDTVEHIPGEMAVFSEALRILKPGGKLMITVPAFQWLWSYNDDINQHQRRYTIADLQHKLGAVGFRIKRISYNSLFLFPLVAAIRMARPYNPGLESPHLTQEEEIYQVEMEPIPEPMNTILHAVYWLEAELLQRIKLPFGVSIICIAEKPA